MTRTGDREIVVLSGILPDNPGELACMLLIIIVAAFVVASESSILDGRPLGSCPKCQRRDSLGRCRPIFNCSTSGKRGMLKKFNDMGRTKLRTIEEDNIKRDNQ